jgi:hypothetical protein
LGISKQTALPCCAGSQTLVKEADEFDVSDEAPRGLVHEARRNFSHETLDAEVGAKSLQHIYEKVEILLERESRKILRHSSILLFHAGTFDDLELMELDGAYRQGIDEGTAVQHHLSGLAGESENEVSAYIYAALRRHAHSPTCCLKVVTAIDPHKSLIIAGFNTIFHNNYGATALMTVDGS